MSIVLCASKFAVGAEMLRQEFNREDNRIKITVNNVWHKSFFFNVFSILVQVV
jgi:hypothetical protein